MHDPMHVVFSIRRPPLKLPRQSHWKSRALAFWSLRDRTVCDRDGNEIRTPLRRRLQFTPAFFRISRLEWYLPSVITVWHRDPQTDGTDSSCRNRIRAKRQAAIKSHRYLAAAWWDWYWRRFDLLHVHHWSVRFDELKTLHRWLFTRCEVCGKRFRYGYSPVNVHGWGARSWQGWFRGERGLSHGGPNGDPDCSAIASLRAQKKNLASWVQSYGGDTAAMRMQREREPYYGCYPWWREAILGEDPTTAAALAAAHVQRSVHPCNRCGGHGTIKDRPEDRECSRCDGTGHERVEHPVPAEAV